MNGVSKIQKALKDLGYYMTYVKYQMYRHADSFHKGELYFMDVYRTSNGYYIKCKDKGKPRYYLCEDIDDMHSTKQIAFSQKEFIHYIGKYFPKMN